MDLWIWLDKVNAEKILNVLRDFGFGSLELTTDDFMNPEQVVQLGYPPVRIDILTDLKGIEFKECYSSRVEVIIDGTKVNFIDRENLKKNKKATGRHQDLADFENL
jgi:hypothetical protein